jgi:phosphatidate phosphatase APP1
MGRVLEDEGIKTTEEDGRLRNLWNSFKRFESDEKSDMRVVAEVNGQEFELTSDDEGYVELDVSSTIASVSTEEQWLPVSLTLFLTEGPVFKVTSRCCLPSNQAEYGVISDVDDTILHTGVSSKFKWRLIVNSIAVGSSARKALAGASMFYKQLKAGNNPAASNPIFYVSNSPWNLHEYLQAFLKHKDFPSGPLLLRDFGRKEKKTKHPFLEGAKYLHIKSIMETYPELPFVLMGDAAELDTDIYLHVHKTIPGRVKAIFIREVGQEKKAKRIRQLLNENKGAPLYLVKSMEEASQIAQNLGLFSL